MGLFDMIKSLHPESQLFGFLNGPPNIQQLIAITQRYEEIETKIKKKDCLYRDFDLLSELSKSRVKDIPAIPSSLEKGSIKLAGIKKY